MLGLLWLVDGGLQFQGFMYSKGFVGMLTGNAAGQPGWLASAIKWGAHVAGTNLALWNTLFALTQVCIGIALLYRRTVKVALTASIAWALVVWTIGEALGMLLANTANPLTGAPGAALLYAILGLLAWPGRPGGLLGSRGAKTSWAAVWLLMGWLWLLGANSSTNATTRAIDAAPSGAGWLGSLQADVANAAGGNGVVIALTLAAASWAIGIAVANDWWPKPFLALAAGLNAAYWVIGQGFGGMLTGSGTDPNAGPLFVVFAAVLYSVGTVGRSQSRSSTAPVLTRERRGCDNAIVAHPRGQDQAPAGPT